jgi:hypothetical protein
MICWKSNLYVVHGDYTVAVVNIDEQHFDFVMGFYQ